MAIIRTRYKLLYTIYQITNKVNGKIYIGKHQTHNLEDGYMGSGTYIKRAIAKYGIVNFEKTILFCFDDEDSMNLKEAELVTRAFCQRDDTYNLSLGGQGGFSYLNDGSESHVERARQAGKKGAAVTTQKMQDVYGVNSPFCLPEVQEKSRNTKRKKYGGVGFQQKTNREDAVNAMQQKYGVENISQHPATNEKIKATFRLIGHQQGAKHSQYGTIWITDGYSNAKIPKDGIVPEGWRKGRTCPPRNITVPQSGSDGSLIRN